MKKIFTLFAAILMAGSMLAETTRIYCKMTQGWWKSDGAAVAVYCWGNEGNKANWPGERMTAVEGETDLWYYDADIATYPNVIFVRVNGTGNIADWGAKTKNLTFPTDENDMFTITSASAVWGDPGCDGEWGKYEPKTEPEIIENDTIYFVNSDQWEEVRVHAWGGTAAGTTWPGLEPTMADYQLQGYDIYYLVAPKEAYQYCIFNNNNKGIQTENLNWTANGYFKAGQWYSREEMELPEIEYTYDTLMYVAGNFTNWAEEMQELPYTINLPADSLLKFKQVKVVITYADGIEESRDTTWYGQANEGYYMTRESNGWMLDGTFNVRLLTDAEGDYTFDFENEHFVVTFPELPEIEYTYDTLMYVAGNFTNWAEEMQELPYTITLPADSLLEFKQVQVVITYADGIEESRDTTWYGQANEGYYMTRESNGWMLDGTFNVLLLTDAEGDYTFDFENEHFVVTFPEKTATDLEKNEAEDVVRKLMKNGQLMIIRNGKQFTATGVEL